MRVVVRTLQHGDYVLQDDMVFPQATLVLIVEQRCIRIVRVHKSLLQSPHMLF